MRREAGAQVSTVDLNISYGADFGGLSGCLFISDF